MLVSIAPGEVFDGPPPEDTARTSILIAMITLSIYMSAVVELKALATFKKHNTLYFWSILVTSWGIILHSLAVLLKFFVASCPWVLYTAFSSFGWWGMVTGQSLVLYSRLHLFVRDKRVLRAILVMIIVNFCLFQVPTTLQKFLSGQSDSGLWYKVYHLYERIQLVVFTIQELAISIIYIRAAVTWLSPGDPEGIRSTRNFLIYLNVLLIALDVAIICEVSTGEWVYEEASQSFAYAIKLTFEFVVLNKVMKLYRHGNCMTCRRRLAPTSFPGLAPDSESIHSSTPPNARPRQIVSTISWNWIKTPWSWKKETKSPVRFSSSTDNGVPTNISAVHGVVTEIRSIPTPTLTPTPRSLEENGDHDCDGIVAVTGITTLIENDDSVGVAR